MPSSHADPTGPLSGEGPALAEVLTRGWLARRAVILDQRSSETAHGEALADDGWFAILTPNVVVPSLSFPDGTVQTSARVAWRAAVPVDEEVELTVSADWLSVRPSSAEVGLTVVASVDGGQTAEALHVVRLPIAGDAVGWGERASMTRPDLGDGDVEATFAVSRAEVRRFAQLAGAELPIHDDVAYCRALGYDDVVVQGLLLVARVAERARLADSAAITAQFLNPVTAGTELSLRRRGTAVWSIETLAANPVVAAIVSIG